MTIPTTTPTRLDSFLRFQETALSLRGQRQQLLASNIANADTPNYQARDIDFSSALKGAMQGTQQGTATNMKGNSPMNMTDVNHINSASADGMSTTGAMTGPSVGPGGAPLLYRTVQQGSVDGNTVDVDTERNQFADNAIRYEASLTMITAQIKSMLAAIQG